MSVLILNQVQCVCNNYPKCFCVKFPRISFNYLTKSPFKSKRPRVRFKSSFKSRKTPTAQVIITQTMRTLIVNSVVLELWTIYRYLSHYFQETSRPRFSLTQLSSLRVASVWFFARWATSEPKPSDCPRIRSLCTVQFMCIYRYAETRGLHPSSLVLRATAATLWARGPTTRSQDHVHVSLLYPRVGQSSI